MIKMVRIYRKQNFKKVDHCLSHCYKFGPYICKKCTRRGLDCLSSCPDCDYLQNEVEFEKKVHWQTDKFIYYAQVLCKKCSEFHIRYSLGAEVFNVRIFTDSKRFPNYEGGAAPKPSIDQKFRNVMDSASSEKNNFAGSDIVFDGVIHERDKKNPKRKPTYVSKIICTRCLIKHSEFGGICRQVCKVKNALKGHRRFWLINGHLHIVDAYCHKHKGKYWNGFISETNVTYGIDSRSAELFMTKNRLDCGPDVGETHKNPFDEYDSSEDLYHDQ